ncbi:type VII secretion protein EccE [Mycobacterium angelicum]|uniref:Type VII secretion protein EccE n=1 Tax=Mycobacterium angelicum TaxID=470074 RepID=A0A1W9ZV88_MYCAN|nr:type VII secretion protein EccE [Mycobacterium angelicum]MCV7200196.1 type VII secretion protein EccE [Mycobacterium angelicum]ORA21707.1 type VII secretion protein EccE [Mycobacterium angelicum]
MSRRGRVQAHRTGWLRFGLPSALVFTLVICALVPTTTGPHGDGLLVWPSALIALAAFVALFVPIRGRVLLVEWIAVVLAFWQRRNRPLVGELPTATDVNAIAGSAGVRWDGYSVVSAVEIVPAPALTHEAGGRAVTDSALPLDLVVSLMRHYDLNLDIDIVSTGRHVPSGSAYRTVYSEIVGPRPIIGQRRTWLVLRLDAEDNLADIVTRGPSGSAAPKALVSATHRVVQRLQQERIRAYALSAAELDDLGAILLQPVGTKGNRERWGTVESGPNYISSYVGDPATLSAEQLDRWWSWRTEDAVVMLRLSGMGTGTVKVGSVVRYVTHGKAYRPLAGSNLALPTGVQRLMLTAPLPAGDRSLEVALPSISVSQLSGLRIPVGPSGQLLGQCDDGTMVALAMWDQSGQPQRRRIDARVSVALAHQLVLRAIVTGAVVGIHTNSRPHWDNLVAAVGDTSRLFYATAGAFACDIAVFDGRPVTTVPARTVMRLLEPAAPAVGGADVTMVEVDGQALQISVGSAEPELVRIIRSREEDRYLAHGEPEAVPRRSVSTEPTLTRTARQPQPQTPEPAPVRTPTPPEAAADTAALAPAGGPSRQRNIAGPQRVTRVPWPESGTQPGQTQSRPQRPRRQFTLPQDPPAAPADGQSDITQPNPERRVRWRGRE